MTGQRIVSSATISDSKSSSAVVTAIILLNNHKSLHIEIWVNKARFDELLPEMTKIANSFNTTPVQEEFRKWASRKTGASGTG